MKPHLDKTKFGSITIDGHSYDYDVLIRLNGSVEKRKKKLSKQVFGTSHTLSLAEAEFAYEDGAEKLIFGTGQSGAADLSPDAEAFFQRMGCQVQALPTPEALAAWNKTSGKLIGLFHITC